MSSNEIDTAGNSFLIKFKKYQFIFLFVELIFLLIGSAVLSNIAPRYSSIVSTVLFLLVLLTTVFVVISDKRLLIVSSFLVFSIVILQILRFYFNSNWIVVSIYLASLMFLSYKISVFFKVLFTGKSINLNIIFASLCIYLLIAVYWAIIYSLLDHLMPGSFSYPFGGPYDKVAMEFAGTNTSPSLYFSLVTLTTLGYGDVVPKTQISGMLAGIEAVIGQLYIAVVIARIVAVYSWKTNKSK